MEFFLAFHHLFFLGFPSAFSCFSSFLFFDFPPGAPTKFRSRTVWPIQGWRSKKDFLHTQCSNMKPLVEGETHFLSFKENLFEKRIFFCTIWSEFIGKICEIIYFS